MNTRSAERVPERPRTKNVLRRWLIPEVAIFVPVAVSVAVWLIPGESYALRGFAARPSLTFGTVLPVLMWYLWITILVHVARRSGAQLAARLHTKSRRGYEPNPDTSKRAKRVGLLVLTSLATIGVAHAVTTAGSLSGILTALESSQANQLSESLTGSAGIATLRYTAAIAAPYSIMLLAQGITRWPLVVWNVLLLLTNALFSSRLSLIMAIIVAAYILTNAFPGFRIRWVAVAIPASLCALALVFFNYSRNANFYKGFGIDDPLSMSFYQFAAYLGTPFQVSLGVSEAMQSSRVEIGGNVLQLLTPTFLRPETPEAVVTASKYPVPVDVAGNLTTNSAFADVASNYGFAGLIAATLVYVIAGFVFGALARQTNALSLIPGVLLYCFAETWRIFLFPQGIVVYLILAAVGVHLIERLGTTGRRSSSSGLVNANFTAYRA